MLSFQEIIAKLNAFWQQHGCVIHQPYDLETGAGTFNPATFLRSLGPEPYKTAYVEPSRRPQDGRYAENPNRVQLFHQYQVIIKPSPFDIQQLYLDSLRALGLPLEKHDIRFVCDDWESPSLGAWGLGWEIWIDGMEASQFTYFQAIGSLMLKPIPVEITYGLERLAMYLQGVDSIFAVKWNDELTFGDIIKQSEIEWSHYNFEEASIEMWARHFVDYEKETALLLKKELPIPAYDFVIKASHAFNMLDARGTISVTERAGYIARIRNLAREVAEGYLAKREKEGFPLLKKREEKELGQELNKVPSIPKGTSHPFLLEIGSEELPPGYVKSGRESLAKSVAALLDAENIAYRGIHTFGTHRRIALFIEDLASEAKISLIEKKGPPLDLCFDRTGHLTVQGKGFLSSFGIESVTRETLANAPELQVREIKGVDYLFAMTSSKATDTAELLSSQLPSLIAGLQFPKKMIWNELDFPYPRPIFSLVCLFGKEVLPFRIANIVSGRTSFGHRQLMPKPIPLASPEEYLSALRPHKVLVDPKEREEFIRKQLAEEEEKLSLRAIEKDRVIAEVLYLSEYPTVTAAHFRAEFLSVPREVLTSEMIAHQRYFPTEKKDGTFANTFFITCDRAPSDLIRKGNQRVLSARLSDGAFLYEQDRKKSLLEWNESLHKMVFYQGLGTVYEKVERIVRHAEALHKLLPFGSKKDLLEAARLCKADLATDMVGEFPELQGTMGRYYALAEGKSEAVARAIEEHWMPQGEHTSLPSTETGILLSLADKLDNLIGYFGIGCKPSSSADPLALRRQAIGIIKLLLPYSIDLGEILRACQPHFPASIAEQKELIEELLLFFATRAKGVYLEKGLAKEEIEACLIDQSRFDPQGTLRKVEALRSLRAQSDTFDKLAEVYKRAKGQLKQGTPSTLLPELCSEKEEKELCSLLLSWESSWPELLRKQNYFEGFEKLATLQPKIGALFDNVKILDEDPKVRANRLALLQKVCSYCDSLLDLSRLSQK